MLSLYRQHKYWRSIISWYEEIVTLIATENFNRGVNNSEEIPYTFEEKIPKIPQKMPKIPKESQIPYAFRRSNSPLGFNGMNWHVQYLLSKWGFSQNHGTEYFFRYILTGQKEDDPCYDSYDFLFEIWLAILLKTCVLTLITTTTNNWQNLRYI